MLDWIVPLYFPHSKEVAGSPLVPQLQEVVELVEMGMEEEDMDRLESVELPHQQCQQVQFSKWTSNLKNHQFSGEQWQRMWTPGWRKLKTLST